MDGRGMKVRFFQHAAIVLSLALTAARASAALSYTTIEHPLARAGGTVPYDVDAGRIAGTYLDAAGVSHAFTYDGATWTTADHPNAAAPRGTSAYGIADGLICGAFVDASGRTHGFIYDGVNWVTLDRPPTGIGPVDTVARGASDDGTVVGYSIESLVARGFVSSGGTFTDLIVPGSVGTFPDDIDGGRIVGTFDDLVGSHGFILQGAALTPVDHPLGTVFGTFLTGVEGANVVGNYLDPLDGSAHAFLFDGRNFTDLDIPGATDTTVHGIGGVQVVGVYVDGAGISHGFVGTIPEPSHAALFLASLVAMRRRVRRV